MVSFRLGWMLLLLLTLASSNQAAPKTAPAISFDPSVTVPYLASDALEGRGIGTHGLDLAADYLADHFRATGLKPLTGLDGYFQPFDYTPTSRPAADCSLTIAGKTLALNQDFRPLGFSSKGSFGGPVVYVHYGISSPENHYDDYAGIDVRGKVVLVMRFEPTDVSRKSIFAPRGRDWSDLAGLSNKILTAQRHGAAALLLYTPGGLEEGDQLLRFTPMSSGDMGVGLLPVMHIKRWVAEAMLDKESVRPNTTASGKVRIERTTVHVKNVIGYFPGAGPHASEYVIVGAHYDHLGRGRFGSIFGPAGAIYHGADDNASGTAAILALAHRVTSGPPRRRTFIFCLFTAEEEGLIGSTYFANHPPIDLSKVVAMLNMDMVGRVRGEKIYVGGNGTARDFDAIVQAADKDQPLIVRPMPLMVGGRGGLGPSDHMSFALKHIPVLFLFSGMHLDYHRPSDTADKVNFAGINEVARFSDRLLDKLAAMPREAYDSSADVGSVSSQGSGDHLSGTTLGVIPDYTTDLDQPGVLIQGVVGHSPAEAAGLQGGDIIVQFGAKHLAGLQDLADALAIARGGDKVELKVKRGKQVLTLHATLKQRG